MLFSAQEHPFRFESPFIICGLVSKVNILYQESAYLCGLYHLTNSDKASRYELAKEFVKLNKFDNEIIPVPMASFNSKVQRPLFTAMSNKKISNELNITIPEWKNSLKKMLESNF